MKTFEPKPVTRAHIAAATPALDKQFKEAGVGGVGTPEFEADMHGALAGILAEAQRTK